MYQQINHFINQFNTAWTEGDIDSLDKLLHDKVIFLAPDLVTQISTKADCVQTIRDYVKSAATHVFEITNKTINVWAQTAMVSIDYYIEYEMQNNNYKEKGTEFWTLIEYNDTWKLVWRAIAKNEKLN